MTTQDLNLALAIIAIIYGGTAAVFAPALGVSVVFAVLHSAATLGGQYASIDEWATYAAGWLTAYTVSAYLTVGRG